MLMLQYVTGGKWGLLLRRPLEAMSRTLPLVALMFIPVLIPKLGKHLYQWIAYPDAASTNNACSPRETKPYQSPQHSIAGAVFALNMT